MTSWIGFKHPKDWFDTKEQFDLVKDTCNIFDAISIKEKEGWWDGR